MRSRTPTRFAANQGSSCRGCKCADCNQIKKDCQEIKKMITEKLEAKRVNEVSMGTPTSVNLCDQEVIMGDEMTINYTYTDLGKQMMILDLGAPVSIAGIPWMTQYLQEFGHTIVLYTP